MGSRAYQDALMSGVHATGNWDICSAPEHLFYALLSCSSKWYLNPSSGSTGVNTIRGLKNIIKDPENASS